MHIVFLCFLWLYSIIIKVSVTYCKSIRDKEINLGTTCCKGHFIIWYHVSMFSYSYLLLNKWPTTCVYVHIYVYSSEIEQAYENYIMQQLNEMALDRYKVNLLTLGDDASFNIRLTT